MKTNQVKISFKARKQTLMNFATPSFPTGKALSSSDGAVPNVALLAAEEFSALVETLYLLKSPKNAARLLDALSRAKRRR